MAFKLSERQIQRRSKFLVYLTVVLVYFLKVLDVILDEQRLIDESVDSNRIDKWLHIFILLWQVVIILLFLVTWSRVYWKMRTRHLYEFHRIRAEMISQASVLGILVVLNTLYILL